MVVSLVEIVFLYGCIVPTCVSTVNRLAPPRRRAAFNGSLRPTIADVELTHPAYQYARR